MGIKFRCPNGHKLNVKSFLAGRRGVCPECQATFRIPEDPGGSDVQAVAIPSRKGAGGVALAVEPAGVGQATTAIAEPVLTTAVVTPTARAATIAADQVSTRPVVTVTTVQPSPAIGPAMPVGAGIPLPAGAAKGAAALATPVVPTTTPVVPTATPLVPTATPGASDPIAESPTAIWYVRPPSGGQYGPARGDIMRKWIGEGRVSGDSLVWREGWTDWRSAGELFPALAAPVKTVQAAAAGPAVVTPLPARTAPRYTPRKKGGAGMAIAALVGLVVVCLVLVGVLVVVLTQHGS